MSSRDQKLFFWWPKVGQELFKKWSQITWESSRRLSDGAQTVTLAKSSSDLAKVRHISSTLAKKVTFSEKSDKWGGPAPQICQNDLLRSKKVTNPSKRRPRPLEQGRFALDRGGDPSWRALRSIFWRKIPCKSVVPGTFQEHFLDPEKWPLEALFRPLSTLEWGGDPGKSLFRPPGGRFVTFLTSRRSIWHLERGWPLESSLFSLNFTFSTKNSLSEGLRSVLESDYGDLRA